MSFDGSKEDGSKEMSNENEENESDSVDDYKCNYCSLSFKSRIRMVLHIKNRHEEEDNEQIKKLAEYFACPFCPQVYDKHNSIYAHLRRSHKNKRKPTWLELTKTGGEKSKDLEKVKPTLKEKEKVVPKPSSELSMKCDECPKEFANIDFLNKHKGTHVTPVEAVSRIYCADCGQVFKGAPELKDHKRTRCVTPETHSTDEARNEDQLTESARREETVEKFGIEDIGNADGSSLNVKKEVQLNEVSGLKNGDNRSRPTVAISKKTIINAGHVGVNLDRWSTAGTRALSIEKELEKSRNETTAQKRAMTAAECSDSDDFMIVPKSAPTKTRKKEDKPVLNDPVEHSPLPVTTVIFNRSIHFPKELMIIWSSALEADILTAVNLNPANSILCVQDLEIIGLNEQQRKVLEKSDMVTFNILTSVDTTSQWTLISSQHPNLNTLKSKLFKNYTEVENVLLEYAASQGVKLINVIRFSKDGLFELLSQSLVEKILACNLTE